MALGAALNAAPSVDGPSGVVAMCNAGEEGSAMSKAAVGLVGWRGMVGSVLMERMWAESDFRDIEPLFFSTSNAGGQAPDIGRSLPPLADAHDLDALMGMDIILSCQGGDYTRAVHPACARRAGAATGSMPPAPCAWSRIPPSSWTR